MTNVPVTTLPIGTNIAGTLHAMIDQPPGGEDVNSAVGKQRLFNEANIVLLVSNTTAQVVIRQVRGAANDPSPTILTFTNLSTSYLSTNLPWLVTNSFTDQRESKVMLVRRLTWANFGQWIITNTSVLGKYPARSGNYPNIFYVADNKTTRRASCRRSGSPTGWWLPTNGGCRFYRGHAQPDLHLGQLQLSEFRRFGHHQHLQHGALRDHVRRLDDPFAKLEGFHQHQHLYFPHALQHHHERRLPHRHRAFHGNHLEHVQRRGA